MVEEEDEKGSKTGERCLIFPRYQQLDCVRRLVADARASGRGAALPDPALGRQRQEQHHRLAGAPALRRSTTPTTGGSSTRSSSSPTGACSTASCRRTVRQFEQTLGVVENIDTTSRQLKEALEDGQDDHRHHAAEVPGHRQARSASCRASASPSSSTRRTPRSRARARRA